MAAAPEEPQQPFHSHPQSPPHPELQHHQPQEQQEQQEEQQQQYIEGGGHDEQDTSVHGSPSFELDVRGGVKGGASRNGRLLSDRGPGESQHPFLSHPKSHSHPGMLQRYTAREYSSETKSRRGAQHQDVSSWDTWGDDVGSAGSQQKVGEDVSATQGGSPVLAFQDSDVQQRHHQQQQQQQQAELESEPETEQVLEEGQEGTKHVPTPSNPTRTFLQPPASPHSATMKPGRNRLRARGPLF